VSNREENRMRKNLSEILKDATNAGLTSSSIEVLNKKKDIHRV
jgi:hypothetical protein